MVFPSSAPSYLDHPINWQQLQQSNPNNHQVIGGIQNSQTLEVLPPPPPPPQLGGSGGGGGDPIRPGSMVDRARIAKVPQPEAGLKCPRCNSNNTKFCYFNNYSLTQPRHFCKTCRRYWTRGGALRSVPVGGGCRRNKRKNSTTSNNNTSKSQVTHDHNQTVLPNKSTNGSPSSSTDIITNRVPQLPSQMHFMPTTLQNLSQYNIGTNNISSFQSQGFQNIGSGNNNINGLFPFLANFETPTNLFSYQNGNSGEEVKMEENRGVDLSRQFTGMNNSDNNNQYWGGGIINTNQWSTDHYSGINTSSTTNLV